MPHQAGAELRAQEGRPRAVSEARGKVVEGAAPAASEITIQVPEGGVAIVDGTSITDAALERKLASAVKRNPALRVKLAYAEKVRARAQVIEALVRKSGVATVELATAP